ncbi:hypothetical protein [Glaciibacter superstes]|nr:hypothetical protein [Glaciibacter superstes]
MSITVLVSTDQGIGRKGLMHAIVPEPAHEADLAVWGCAAAYFFRS